jgi:hypothetical protein
LNCFCDALVLRLCPFLQSLHAARAALPGGVLPRRGSGSFPSGGSMQCPYTERCRRESGFREPPGRMWEHPDRMWEHPDRMWEHPDRMWEHPGRMREPPGRMREPPGSMWEPPGRMREPPGRMREPPDRMREPPGSMWEWESGFR